MSISSWLSSPLSRSQARRAKRGNVATPSPHRRHTMRPGLESLETRFTLSLTQLASFLPAAGGYRPVAGLIMDGSGNLYGTTPQEYSSDGTVFELAKGSGTITTLASFNGTNGSDPLDALILDSSGNLYGTTGVGGASNDGTVFELAKGSGTITTLASFHGTDGGFPIAGLITDGSGNLYGTTQYGGASKKGDGTVFELARGSGTITTLASFFGDDGASPCGALIMDSSGNLYGTTAGGGDSKDGTVFELVHGKTKITRLASFNGTDGANPAGRLIMDGSGNLYGTAALGGDSPNGTVASGDGTVFELAHGSGTITTLASFNGTNSSNPEGALIMDSSGNLYGTASGVGFSPESHYGPGTIFELAKGSGTITTLAWFDGTYAGVPNGDLITDSSGNLYGTEAGGGEFGYGAVFELPGAIAPTSLQISALPSSIGAGTPQTFAVTAQIADGTTETGFTGTVHFTGTDIAAKLPKNYTFTASDKGKHTFSGLVLKTKGKQSITAKETHSKSITGSLSEEVS